MRHDWEENKLRRKIENRKSNLIEIEKRSPIFKIRTEILLLVKNHEYTGVAPRTGFFHGWLILPPGYKVPGYMQASWFDLFSNIRYRSHPGTGTTRLRYAVCRRHVGVMAWSLQISGTGTIPVPVLPDCGRLSHTDMCDICGGTCLICRVDLMIL